MVQRVVDLEQAHSGAEIKFIAFHVQAALAQLHVCVNGGVFSESIADDAMTKTLCDLCVSHGEKMVRRSFDDD